MINLLIGGNNFVCKGLLVVICSIIKHVKEPVTIYFLTMDLSDVNPKYIPLKKENELFFNSLLKKQNENSCFKTIDCTYEFKSIMQGKRNINGGYTPYALIRLFADLKKEIPDKVLYLDTDVIIADDISSLYHLDVEDYELAGCLDYYGRFWIKRNYLNSGVLLLNMKMIKKTKFMEKCRQYCKKSKGILADQDAINNLSTKKLILDDKYNEQSRYPKSDTVIKHFSKQINYIPTYTINIKPWDVYKVHSRYKMYQYDDILNDYLSLQSNLIF